jgi:hypothetical protein
MIQQHVVVCDSLQRLLVPVAGSPHDSVHFSIIRSSLQLHVGVLSRSSKYGTERYRSCSLSTEQSVSSQSVADIVSVRVPTVRSQLTRYLVLVSTKLVRTVSYP